MDAVLITVLHTWWVSGPIALAVAVDALQSRRRHRVVEVPDAPVPYRLTAKAQQLLDGGAR